MYILGGFQTDFARKWTSEGLRIGDMIAECAHGVLDVADVEAGDVGVGHIGNFGAERFCDQSQLGGLLVEADPAFVGLPVTRHETACASGSAAAIAAGADLESGRYDVALVVGVELMRTTTAVEAQAHLGTATFQPHETAGLDMPWPQLFSDLGDAYEARYGLDAAHLDVLVRSAYSNAKRNPHAQTRHWGVPDDLGDARANPTICGRIRRYDCSQVTDGGAAVVLASDSYAHEWARRRGRDLASVPRVLGWGFRVGRMAMQDKIADSRNEAYVFPEVRATVVDALDRAHLVDIRSVDVAEIHDCFATSYYMQIDHLGLAEPGQPWQVIEDGTVLADGKLPINPGGGLIGIGHPVGATGVRMLVDAVHQVGGLAGDYQVDGARRALTLNIGGSVTSSAALVVGVD